MPLLANQQLLTGSREIGKNPLLGGEGVKKSGDCTRPLTPGPSPRWGEGKVSIRFNSLARTGERDERLISVHKGA